MELTTATQYNHFQFHLHWIWWRAENSHKNIKTNIRMMHSVEPFRSWLTDKLTESITITVLHGEKTVTEYPERLCRQIIRLRTHYRHHGYKFNYSCLEHMKLDDDERKKHKTLANSLCNVLILGVLSMPTCRKRLWELSFKGRYINIRLDFPSNAWFFSIRSSIPRLLQVLSTNANPVEKKTCRTL